MKLLRPEAIEVTHTVDEGIEAILLTKRPFVSEVSDRLLSDPFTTHLLDHHGYRFVERRLEWRTQLMARPPTLAWFMRRRVDVRRGFWAMARWLYDRGVFHLTTPEGVVARWRDVRPGPRRAE